MKKILSILAAVLLSLMVVVPIAAAGPSTKLERRVVPVSAIAATTSRVSAPAPTITRAPLRSLVPIRALVMAPTAPASASTDGVVFGSCEVTITSTENIDFITSTSSTNDGYTVTPIPNAEVNITITGDVNSVTLVTGSTETTHARPADITNSCLGTPNQATFNTAVVFGPCEVTITSTENIDFITSTSSTNDGYTVTPIPNAEVNITITGDVNSVTLVTGSTETTHARPADITNSCPGTPNQSIFHN